MEQDIKIWEHPQFGEIGLAIDDGKLWFEAGAIVQLKHKKKSMGGNDYLVTEGHRKKFRFSYQKNGRGRFSRTFVDLVGARQLAEHTEDENNKKRTQEFVDWLVAVVESGKDLELFSKLTPIAEKEPCTKPATPNIYDCIEATRNDLNVKIGELQGIIDTMTAKWKNCVDTGLRYKSERDNMKADPQKVKSLELENARLKVLVGFRDILTRKFAGTYKNVGNEFEIKNEPLHEPLEIANYFGTTSQEVNVWLMEHGLQEKVENPSWGEAKYRPLPTPLGPQLAEVVYREEDGKKYHHLQWTTFGVSYIIGSMIFEKEKWDNID